MNKTENQEKKERAIKDIVLTLADILPELEQKGDIFSADLLRFDLIDLLKGVEK